MKEATPYIDERVTPRTGGAIITNHTKKIFGSFHDMCGEYAAREKIEGFREMRDHRSKTFFLRPTLTTVINLVESSILRIAR